MDDKHTEGRELSLKPMQQTCQFLQDPVADFLDDLCCQSHGSLASYELKCCYDQDMIRQLVACSATIRVSFQSSTETLQPYHKLHEDAKIIDTVLDHVVDLAKFKNQGTSQFYLDPIVTYMENFFIVEPQSISGINFILQDYRGLCCKDHTGNQSLTPLRALVLMLIENNEKTRSLDRLLDWTHWHFSIT
jgi:hypothetical protein